MTRSRAAVLRNAPGELEICEVDIADPGPQEVLVRTVAAGVCHSDLHFMQGVMPHPLPTILGHEAAGIVEKVGSDVTSVEVGDHVVTCLSAFCGRCGFCLSGRPALCEKRGLGRTPGEAARITLDGEPVTQFLNLSSFSELALVHQNALVAIDPEMPLAMASLLGCGVLTGFGAVWRTASVRPGETVAVLGCGGVGLSAVHAADLVSAGRIIAIDTDATKLDLAREFGATDVVDASSEDPVAVVQELTRGGVDHAFEAVGRPSTTEQAFAMTGRGGDTTIIGMIPPGAQVTLPGIAFMTEKRVLGTQIGSNQFVVDIPRLVNLCLRGRLKLENLVSGTCGLDEVNEAYRQLQSGGVARQLITFEGTGS